MFGATGSKEPSKSIEKTLDEAHFNLIRREESVQKLKNCRVQSLDDWTCEGFTVFGYFGKKTKSITLQNGEWLINGLQSDDIFGWKISWFLKRNSFYGINPLSTKYKPCENDICFVDTLKNRNKRLEELKKKFFRADVRG